MTEIAGGINNHPKESPYFWHADGCYLPPCIESLIVEGTPWGDTAACAKAVVMWYKGQGAGKDYEYDYPILEKVLQGVSSRSKEKLTEDEIKNIITDN